MTELFESCGLIATFIATLLEGEVFFTTAIVSAKLGTFSFTGALIAGFWGSYLQGWFKYFVAKKYGVKLLSKSAKLDKKIQKSAAWYDKNPVLYVILYKFLFGLTTVILVLSGLRDMGFVKFAVYSAISSLLWVAVFGVLGYYCADFVLDSFASVRDHKYKIIGGLSILGFIVWYWKHRQHLKHCMEIINDNE